LTTLFVRKSRSLLLPPDPEMWLTLPKSQMAGYQSFSGQNAQAASGAIPSRPVGLAEMLLSIHWKW
jgi:hypothetical protein